MKNFIPKTINDDINYPTNLIENPLIGKNKSFNTECPDFLEYVN